MVSKGTEREPEKSSPPLQNAEDGPERDERRGRMALGKLEPKAVVDDLEEKKPKRGASCGEADTRAVRNAPSRGIKPRSRGLKSAELSDLGGYRVSEPDGPTLGSGLEDNGKGEAALDESVGLREERSP